MKARPTDLPDFERPPLAEVALSVQFEPIDGLGAARLGLLWSTFRNRFPSVEEHPQLPPTFEDFQPPSPPKVEIVLEQKAPVPRLWFLNDPKTELIQVQPDRFIHNWRRLRDGEPYPHFEAIHESFVEELKLFEAFLRSEELGRLKVNQCELTYVNQIEPSAVWRHHGEVGQILRLWSPLLDASILGEPEDVGMRIRYRIPGPGAEPIGRLNVFLEPGFKVADHTPVYTLNLVARGKPLAEGIEGASAFFELGRRWIVKGFSDLTGHRLQYDIWGKQPI